MAECKNILEVRLFETFDQIIDSHCHFNHCHFFVFIGVLELLVLFGFYKAI